MLAMRSILVPVDFSAGSADALRYALGLRRGERSPARDARIEVVHATGARVPHAADDTALALVRRGEGDRLRSFVAEIAGVEAPAIETAIVEGEPRVAIPGHAERFDVVVIGATGRLSPTELVPGGVAEATVRRSAPPVLTVKWLSSLSEVEGGRETIAPREVVFATDFTEFSAQALRYAMAIGFAYDARVTALHVVPNRGMLEAGRGFPFPLAEAVDRFYEEELHWSRDELGRFIHDRLGASRPVEIREVVRAGRPAEEIAAECRARSADLLIMATHGRSGLKRGLLGSVAESALRLAPCPVLTIRPKA